MGCSWLIIARDQRSFKMFYNTQNRQTSIGESSLVGCVTCFFYEWNQKKKNSAPDVASVESDIAVTILPFTTYPFFVSSPQVSHILLRDLMSPFWERLPLLSHITFAFYQIPLTESKVRLEQVLCVCWGGCSDQSRGLKCSVMHAEPQHTVRVSVPQHTVGTSMALSITRDPLHFWWWCEIMIQSLCM